MPPARKGPTPPRIGPAVLGRQRVEDGLVPELRVEVPDPPPLGPEGILRRHAPNVPARAQTSMTR